MTAPRSIGDLRAGDLLRVDLAMWWYDAMGDKVLVKVGEVDGRGARLSPLNLKTPSGDPAEDRWVYSTSGLERVR